MKPNVLTELNYRVASNERGSHCVSDCLRVQWAVKIANTAIPLFRLVNTVRINSLLCIMYNNEFVIYTPALVSHSAQ